MELAARSSVGGEGADYGEKWRCRGTGSGSSSDGGEGAPSGSCSGGGEGQELWRGEPVVRRSRCCTS
jgi:hypothetical protein